VAHAPSHAVGAYAPPAQELPPAEIDADVLIVGSGVAGALVASRLARAGVRVVILEAGPPIARSEALANYRNAAIRTPDAPYPSPPYAPAPSVLDPQGYYVQDGADLFKSTYVRYVGGTTWHWLGTSLRHLPNDFQIKTLYGVGVDWPITYDELEPWYGQAEMELGVAGNNDDDLGSPRSSDYPMKALPASYLDQQVSMAASSLGLHLHVNPQARNSIPYDGRPPCCGSATCVPICPIGAKYDATVHLRQATSYGARLIDSAVVHKVEVAPGGSVSGVIFRHPDGSDHRATGRIVVLAAHAIETPKILLLSRTESLPNGVANSSDQVGRNLADHPIQLSWALAEHPLYPFRSPLENAGIEDYRDGDFRREHAAFRMALGEDGWSFPGTPPDVLVSKLAAAGVRGHTLVEQLNAHVARQFRFATGVEELPNPNNRVQPAWEHLDAIGIPRPRLTYALDDYTRAGMAEARRVSDTIFQAMGALYIEHAPEHEGSGHVIGTCCMGADPRSSVVDREQRTHDHPNLFIVGSSVFPTVATANPTLTLAALSLWAAQTILRYLPTLATAPPQATSRGAKGRGA
jgi:choline dehydrogenase-like flavoprotein